MFLVFNMGRMKPQLPPHYMTLPNQPPPKPLRDHISESSALAARATMRIPDRRVSKLREPTFRSSLVSQPISFASKESIISTELLRRLPTQTVVIQYDLLTSSGCQVIRMIQAGFWLSRYSSLQGATIYGTYSILDQRGHHLWV